MSTGWRIIYELCCPQQLISVFMPLWTITTQVALYHSVYHFRGTVSLRIVASVYLQTDSHKCKKWVQNLDVNLGSRPDTILSGSPCNLTMLSKKHLAASFTMYDVLDGMKWTRQVNQSTQVVMLSKSRSFIGKWVMKSVATDPHLRVVLLTGWGSYFPSNAHPCSADIVKILDNISWGPLTYVSNGISPVGRDL